MVSPVPRLRPRPPPARDPRALPPGSGVWEPAPLETEGVRERLALQLSPQPQRGVAMSGLSRLLWAAACLAALCVLTAAQNSTLAPNVTSVPPNHTVTTPPTVAPLTTVVPGG